MGSAAETDSLLDFDPNWCLFWGQGVTGFHLDIWLPYIRQSRNRFVIMAGEDRFSDYVRQRVDALPNCVILEPFAMAKPWLKLCPNFRGFLYIGTKQENFKIVNSYGGKLHVWLGHGESDKIYNAFRTASLYDSMFVARYGVVKRYPRAIRRWVAQGACAIGTPIVDGLVKDPWEKPRPVRDDPVRPHLGRRLAEGRLQLHARRRPGPPRGAARTHGAGRLGDHAAPSGDRPATTGAHRAARRAVRRWRPAGTNEGRGLHGGRRA